MKRLNRTTKATISRDWLGQFPELGIYVPMHLLRRNGPLLTGVILERTSSGIEYRPHAHVHCLLRPRASISLTLAHCLKSPRNNAPLSIELSEHERVYVDSAAMLAEQWELPLHGDVSLLQVLECYNKYMNMGAPNNFCNLEFEDMVLLAAWGGRLDEAKSLLQEFVSRIEGWPDHVVEEMGGIAKWKESLESRMMDRRGLTVAVEAQVRGLNLDHLPEGRLVR